MSERTSTLKPFSGFSRRDFLRGSGAAAAGAALQQTATAVAQEVKQGAAVVSEATALELDVNGKMREVKVEPRTTLLEALRSQLDLTGAKPICNDGSSGGATVLIDGKPMQANMMLALQAAGKKIQTVESLAGDAVPAAFVEADAQQCGFCTPGFVVAVKAFLTKNPKATDEEVRKGLNGNLCRCGTYANIVRACTAVVKGASNG
jgi:xanthine dehydrogenase YagT iron-sulfur-binding subunit